jgi:putative flippase GtrA
MSANRFATFSFVGAAGFVAQLTALWVLTERFGLHYLLSTALATELALLLNFVGHESWTWSDRPAQPHEVLRRLWRFHGVNGFISLSGGLMIMPFLVDAAGLHLLIANTLTVGICAVANFVFADRLVFRPAAWAALAFVAAGAGPISTVAHAAELRTDIIEAFDRYKRLTETRMENEVAGRAPFLWLNRLDELDRRHADIAVRGGEIVTAPLQTLEAGRTIEVSGGLIHHWIATTFIPGATVDQAVALMQGYDRYQEVYSPNVRRSRLVRRDGDRFTVSLQLFMKKVVSVVLNTENDVLYRRVSSTRAFVRSYSTRIAEVSNAGDSVERELPVGQDSGYLWRFNNYCSLEQREASPAGAAGTYVQCESLSLSRGVPTGLGWLIGPFVTSIPRESLAFTLGRMRTSLMQGPAGV